MTKNNTLVIGLTGGIGSGKSTVAFMFAKLGITVIEADQLARQITKPGQSAFNAIIGKLGHGILTSSGHLDRRKLRQQIFTDKILRKWLEQRLHPAIRALMQQKIQCSYSPYCIVVIPLLIENLPNPLVKRIVVVESSKKLQLERTMERDQSTAKEAAAIIAAQASCKQRLNYADDIIKNNSTLSDLARQVKNLHDKYLKLVKKLYS